MFLSNVINEVYQSVNELTICKANSMPVLSPEGTLCPLSHPFSCSPVLHDHLSKPGP